MLSRPTVKMARMDFVSLVVGVAGAGPVGYVLARTHGLRQLGDLRATTASDLASAAQDNKWLREEVDRHKQAAGSTQELLDKAQQMLRDTFHSLAAQALKENRSS